MSPNQLITPQWWLDVQRRYVEALIQTHIAVNHETGAASLRGVVFEMTYADLPTLLADYKLPAVGRVWIHVE